MISRPAVRNPGARPCMKPFVKATAYNISLGVGHLKSSISLNSYICDRYLLVLWCDSIKGQPTSEMVFRARCRWTVFRGPQNPVHLHDKVDVLCPMAPLTLVYSFKLLSCNCCKPCLLYEEYQEYYRTIHIFLREVFNKYSFTWKEMENRN